jgi:DNA modification methylase
MKYEEGPPGPFLLRIFREGTMQIKEIKVNPKNPRIIKDARFQKLVKSIEEFPEMMKLRPIVVDADGMILGGNMRYKALQHLGFKEIPDEWVKRADELTEEQKKRFIIADNAPYGEWDWDILANEWDAPKLSDWGIDFPEDWMPKQEAQEDDYEVPDEIETDIALGDLFEIGPHRLLCGDSTDSEQMAKLMNGEKADMVFTDPPYGVEIGAKNRFLNSFQKAGRNLKDIKDDNISRDELYNKLVSAFTNLKNYSNDCCTYFVTAPQGGELGMMMMMMRDAGLPVRHVLMWYKNAPTFSMGRLDYEYQHEPILLTWNKTHKFYGLGEHKTSVWKVDKPRSNKEHPTMKPVKLVENALLNNSKEQDNVADIYLGSGTTMVAAHQLNRKCYGMEIDSKYCSVIIDRMRKLDPNITIKRNGELYEKKTP